MTAGRQLAELFIAIGFTAMAAFAFAFLLLTDLHTAAAATKPALTKPAGPRGPSPNRGNDYVGSMACTSCHAAIAEEFAQTAMGRSISPVTPSLIEGLKLPGLLDDPGHDRHFKVFSQSGRLYQSEWQPAKDGTEVFRDTHEISWIVGAGANGFGGLVAREGYLFQAPLSFYTQASEWGLSPGYEFADLGFSRPVLAPCLACHAGRARPVSSTNGGYQTPPFSQASIGCENCHGPGGQHIQAMHSKLRRPHSTTTAIINPAQLTPRLVNDLCMSCHQIGDVRILKPGKTYADFRPGQPLDDVMTILMVPPRPNSPPDPDHLGLYYTMSLSKCFRASQGSMSCITCHDPHFQPSHEQAPAYFAQKCLTCHTQQSCKQTPAIRNATTPANNCISCHMPKRDVITIQHASITNHRVLARPGEAIPRSVYEHITDILPDLIHLNPALGHEAETPPGITLLQAYGELLDSHPEYMTSYSSQLDRLEQLEPDNPVVQAALGRRDLQHGLPTQALKELQLAVAEGSRQATTYADIGTALEQMGRPLDALAARQTAVELDPFNPTLQKSEIVSYINLKQYDRASAALRHYLQTFPQDDFMRHMQEMANTKEGSH